MMSPRHKIVALEKSIGGSLDFRSWPAGFLPCGRLTASKFPEIAGALLDFALSITIKAEFIDPAANRD
jgi:hypothetical protein